MKRKLIGGGIGLALLAALTFQPGWSVTVPPPQGPGHGPAQQAPGDPALLARGKYLTDLGDCVACHQANGGQKFAGGQYMGMPFGDISTPNITPDVDTGIGRWTDAEWLRLMRRGVTRSGEHIYPAMPYPWYATVSDDDLLAIKAYLFSLQPVHAPRLPNKIFFPFNLRPLIAVYNVLAVPGSQFKPDPKLNESQNRGAYIVNGLEHCGTCHNGNNLLGNAGLAREVGGDAITKWYAPSLRFDKDSGLGSYPYNDIVGYLKNGHSESMGTVAGPMKETVDESLSKLNDADLHAIVDYLQTLPATSSYTPRQGARNSDSYRAGQQVFLSNCSSCHQVDGRGIKDRIPALDGNGMVRAFGPQSVIRVVLAGLEARGPYAPMPGLGAKLTDQQVSDVTNYVRQSWSNGAPANSGTALVSLLRADTKTLLNGQRPDGCPNLADDKLNAALSDGSNGIAATLRGTTLPNMLQSVNALAQKVRAAAPGMAQDDIVNGMTVAYCQVVFGNGPMQPDDRLWQLDHFADRLYTQLANDGKY